MNVLEKLRKELETPASTKLVRQVHAVAFPEEHEGAVFSKTVIGAAGGGSGSAATELPAVFQPTSSSALGKFEVDDRFSLTTANMMDLTKCLSSPVLAQQVTHVSFSKVNLRSCSSSLSTALRSLRFLTHLRLADALLGDDAATSLLDALRQSNQTLQQLSLRRNKLAYWVPLSEFLIHHPTIAFVDLSCNFLGDPLVAKQAVERERRASTVTKPSNVFAGLVAGITAKLDRELGTQQHSAGEEPHQNRHGSWHASRPKLSESSFRGESALNLPQEEEEPFVMLLRSLLRPREELWEQGRGWGTALQALVLLDNGISEAAVDRVFHMLRGDHAHIVARHREEAEERRAAPQNDVPVSVDDIHLLVPCSQLTRIDLSEPNEASAGPDSTLGADAATAQIYVCNSVTPATNRSTQRALKWRSHLLKQWITHDDSAILNDSAKAEEAQRQEVLTNSDDEREGNEKEGEDTPCQGGAVGAHYEGCASVATPGSSLSVAAVSVNQCSVAVSAIPSQNSRGSQTTIATTSAATYVEGAGAERVQSEAQDSQNTPSTEERCVDVVLPAVLVTSATQTGGNSGAPERELAAPEVRHAPTVDNEPSAPSSDTLLHFLRLHVACLQLESLAEQAATALRLDETEARSELAAQHHRHLHRQLVAANENALHVECERASTAEASVANLSQLLQSRIAAHDKDAARLADVERQHAALREQHAQAEKRQRSLSVQLVEQLRDMRQHQEEAKRRALAFVHCEAMTDLAGSELDAADAERRRLEEEHARLREIANHAISVASQTGEVSVEPTSPLHAVADVALYPPSSESDSEDDGFHIVDTTKVDPSFSAMTKDKWQPDDKVRCCASCKREFGVLRRKHHCRRCGWVLCDSCCPKSTAHGANRICTSCLAKSNDVAATRSVKSGVASLQSPRR